MAEEEVLKTFQCRFESDRGTWGIRGIPLPGPGDRSYAAAMMSEPPPPGKCFRMNAEGELPTCTWDGQRWSASYDGFGDFRGGAAAGRPGSSRCSCSDCWSGWASPCGA